MARHLSRQGMVVVQSTSPLMARLPWQLRQPLTGFVSLEHPLDLLVGRRDPLIQGLEFLGECV